MIGDDAKRRLVVRFTEQQVAMLESFRARYAQSASLEEVVVNLFRQYAESTLRDGKGGR